MNIYVANFDTAWKDEDLRQLFTPYGEVASASVEMDVFTEKSRGFGYVDMPDESAAQAAIAALHQKDVNGSALDVKQAEPKVISKGSYKVGNGGVNPYRFRKN
ncbi:RNA-binding protein [Flavisolibacter sp. BT320]|nr:RNA-binding protein [Flavisolibacter longurius]